jgi:hypothetical protein
VERGLREVLAFILNFVWPGLGFLFSGFIHNHEIVRLIGIGITIVTLFSTVVSIGRMSLPSFFDDILIAAIADLIWALLGAAVEHELGIRTTQQTTVS